MEFEGRKVLYTWIGGTRRDWRGQGHFRALTEESEAWAFACGYDEVVVKTKNKFFEMREHARQACGSRSSSSNATPTDSAESKVYLSKKLHAGVLQDHRSLRTVVQV